MRRSAGAARSAARTTSSRCRPNWQWRARRLRARDPAGLRAGATSPRRRSGATSSPRATRGSRPAIAAREYQPHLFIEDLVALRELFLKEIGQPRWTIIYGQSMGGHIAVASLELRPGLYQGGLAECGLVDGIGIADYLMAYTAAAELISGRAAARCARPGRRSTRLLNERVRAGARHARLVHRARTAVRQRREVPDGRRSGRQRSAAAPSRAATRATSLNMMYRPPDLEHGAESRPARGQHRPHPVPDRSRPRPHRRRDQRDASGGSTRAKDARSPSANPVYAERTGRLTVPLITLHETGDAWVPLSLEQSYRRRTIAAGTDHLLVQRVVRAASHCGVDGKTRQPGVRRSGRVDRARRAAGRRGRARAPICRASA